MERHVKNENEIAIMTEAGKILGDILVHLKKMIKPGLNTMDLENEFLKLCTKYDVEPSCKGYSSYGLKPFPTGLCISVNNEGVHCYPHYDKILKEGDVVTVDTVIKHKDLHADSAFATTVGTASEENKRFVETCEKVMYQTINKVKAGVKIGVLSHTMEKLAKKAGYNVLEDYAGHGIGYEMHEYPQIPCSGSKYEGPKLKAGMTICIEALFAQGKGDVIATAGWETEMADGKNFCQFEHTVLVTKDGYRILTK